MIIVSCSACNTAIEGAIYIFDKQVDILRVESGVSTVKAYDGQLHS